MPTATIRVRRARVAFVAALSLAPALASAQPQEEHDTSALAKETQNPVGGVTSLPFQFNFNTGGGLADQTFVNVIFQPVFSLEASPTWNVIVRTVIPMDSLPTDSGRSTGIGDIQEQLYVSPAATPRPISSSCSRSSTTTSAAGGRPR